MTGNADKLLLDARMSPVQISALGAWLDDIARDLPPSSAGVVQERFDHVKRRAELAHLGADG